MAITVVVATAAERPLPTPPTQPTTGPGGCDYAHRTIRRKEYGQNGQAYWLLEPANPLPKHAPLIVFNHGWAAIQPQSYDAWLKHLVKRGNIVIYPRYQEGLLTPPSEFTPNAIAAIKNAIQRLQNEAGHVRPELENFALVGHSMGGVISANIAVLWQSVGLPKPKVVMPVEPGKTWGMEELTAVKMEDLSRMAPDTLLLCVAGDRDQIVRDVDARRIFNEATQVTPANKNLVTLVTDDHGTPALVADHFAPCTLLARVAGGALDYYGTWKLFDALCDAAFRAKNRQYALGNTPEQRFMGKWSDNVPVKELKVTLTDNPAPTVGQ